MKNPGMIRHAGRLVVEDFAEIQGLSSGGIVLGSQVSIGRNTMIRPSSYYGGPVGEGLIMGDRSSLASDCYIGCSGMVTIGNDVMLGPGVRVFAENHEFSGALEPIKSQGVRRAACVIEDDCWIGAGSTITAGVRIGHGTVIGAGSVVTKDIPPKVVAAGSPAEVIRFR